MSQRVRAVVYHSSAECRDIDATILDLFVCVYEYTNSTITFIHTYMWPSQLSCLGSSAVEHSV